MSADADLEDARAVRAYLAIGCPHPAEFAFGLLAQFPLVAKFIASAKREPGGWRLRCYIDDERLRLAIAMGLVPVLGTFVKSRDEERRRGFFLTSYGRLVRKEVKLLLWAREELAE